MEREEATAFRRRGPPTPGPGPPHAGRAAGAGRGGAPPETPGACYTIISTTYVSEIGKKSMIFEFPFQVFFRFKRFFEM